jgi:hypothetical protein
VRKEASIEAVRFRCNVQALSRLRALLTHRNLRHAGRRLKRAFRFRKVLWLLSSKESNNKKNLCSNTALCLRHGMGRDAPGLDVPNGTGSPARHLLRRRRSITQGQGSALTPNTAEQKLIPERDSSPPESHGHRGPLHDTNMRRNRKPAPSGIGGGARRQASIEGVRFRCRQQTASRLHSLLTHRNLWHAGRRLKRAFPFRKVLWLLSSKESNNKKNLCSNTALCLRHGVGRDAPVLCVGLKPRRITE